MTAQSPVDLPEAGCPEDTRPIRFEYGPVEVVVDDTGSPDPHATVKARVAPGLSIQYEDRRWEMMEFHWHVPSEHSIGGRRAAMELHAVHRDEAGELLVVAVMAEEGEWNAVAAPLFSSLPLAGPGTVAFLDLDRLIPVASRSYRYRGSLTTPPYTEGVEWVVLAETIHLSPRQVDSFRRLFPQGNARDTQPLDGRRVACD